MAGLKGHLNAVYIVQALEDAGAELEAAAAEGDRRLHVAGCCFAWRQIMRSRGHGRATPRPRQPCWENNEDARTAAAPPALLLMLVRVGGVPRAPRPVGVRWAAFIGIKW